MQSTNQHAQHTPVTQSVPNPHNVQQPIARNVWPNHTMTNALTDVREHDNNVYIGNGDHIAQGWRAPVMPHVVHDA